MSTNDSRRLYPVFAMLLGASMWGVIWYPMRLLESGGLHGLWLTFVLYATALVVSLPRTAPVVREFGRNPVLIALLILSGGWTNVAFILAVLEGNVLRVLLLFYLSPLWATLMAWLFLRERISRAAFLSLALAMIGAMVMLWNKRIGAPWPQGGSDWLALSSGFAFALSIVTTRKMRDISVAGKALCVWIGVAVIAAAMLLTLWVPVPRAELSIYGGAVALGIGGILVMTLFVQYGVTHMPVHRSAVLALIEVLAGAVSQQLLTNEVVELKDWIGGALILVGAYLSARGARRAP